jgi:hypothetical protein
VEPGGKGPLPSSSIERDLIIVAPAWKADVVPNNVGNVQGLPTPNSSERESNPTNSSTIDAGCGPLISCVEYLRDDTKSNNFRRKLQTSCSYHGGRNTPKHMIHNSRNGLAGAKEGGADPISCPIEKVVNFLADLFSQGYQYRSLNAYRSAISSVHDKE